MSITSVTVTGTIENAATTPVSSATITFQLSAPITDGTTLIEPTLLSTTTNSSGQFSIALLANDDPTTTPKGTSYAVTITAGTWTDSWSVVVPHSAAPTVDLFALAVLSPPSTPAQPFVSTLEGLNGAISLSSPNSSLAITASGQTVSLETTNNITVSQQSASYTLALTDAGTEIDYTGTAAGTFTIPANSSVSFPVGTKIRCRQTNTGTLTLAPASGVTLYNGSTTSGNVILSEEAYLVEITQTATNVWATSWPTSGGSGSAGVSSLEGLTGAVTFSSPNNSVAVGTSGQAVTLAATRTIPISQQSASYTFALTDAGTEVEYTGTAAGTFTIPANSSVNFPVGTRIRCRQTNTGALTLSPASGVSLYNGSTTSGSVTLSEEVYVVEITQTATNVWATSWPISAGGGGGTGYTAAPGQTISANTTLTGSYNLYPLLLNASANITAPRAPSSGADYLQYHIHVGTAGATPTILDASGNAAVWVNGIIPSWDTTAGDEYWVTANPNEAGTNWVWNTTAQVLKGALLAANNLSDVVNPAQALANIGGVPIVENVYTLGASGTVTLRTPNATTPDTIQMITQSGALTLVNWASPSVGQSAELRIVANGSSITFPTTNTRWAGTVSGAGSPPAISAAGTYDFTIKCLDGTNYDWTFIGRFA